jgi:hypothetical protein
LTRTQTLLLGRANVICYPFSRTFHKLYVP